jgi:hypothetical protein
MTFSSFTIFYCIQIEYIVVHEIKEFIKLAQNSDTTEYVLNEHCV